MKKTFKSYCFIWIILLLLFNIIAFFAGGLINVEKYTISFWIGYLFITLAFIGQFLCAQKAFQVENFQKLFYNIPLIYLSRIGLIATFFAGGLCMSIARIPYWVSIIICMSILTITAIAVMKADIVADVAEEVDKKIRVKTFFIKSLTVDSEELFANAQTAEIKAECKSVYDVIRYSDPMSNDELSATESQIILKFAEFTAAVKTNNLEAVKKSAKEVIALINDRNKKCRLLK